MKPIEAVLFDFDGVLVDSEPVHFECWNEILAPFGLSLSWEEYERHCIGVADRAMIDALCRLSGRPELFDAIWAEYPRKKAVFRERMAQAVPMPETVKRMLRGGLNGMPLAVVSSSGRLEVEGALELAGVRHAFRTVVTGEDVRQLKPSPEPYRTAAARLGVGHALVVEDSDAGVASGEAAGFEVLRVGSAGETAGRVLGRLGLDFR
jgi:HAD superfamily hydrolase (TIGR01509 family)